MVLAVYIPNRVSGGVLIKKDQQNQIDNPVVPVFFPERSGKKFRKRETINSKSPVSNSLIIYLAIFQIGYEPVVGTFQPHCLPAMC